MGRFVAARGFELMDVERIAPKGGSIRFYLQHKGGPRKISARVDEMTATEASRGLFDGRLFEQFNRRIGQIGADIRDRLTASKRTTGRALAYGSSVGCGALIQYFDLANILDAVFDDLPLTNFIRTGAETYQCWRGRNSQTRPPPILCPGLAVHAADISTPPGICECWRTLLSRTARPCLCGARTDNVEHGTTIISHWPFGLGSRAVAVGRKAGGGNPLGQMI